MVSRLRRYSGYSAGPSGWGSASVAAASSAAAVAAGCPSVRTAC